jgi:hypothetical protein
MTGESEQSQPPEDDPDIPDHERLFRRLDYEGGSWVTIHKVTGERRPSSAGFDPDTDGLSVFRESVLTAQEPPLGPVGVGEIVASFTVADVRSLRLGVKNDAWPQDVPDPDQPRYAAHALITGLLELGRNQQRKRKKQLVEVQSMQILDCRR